MNLPRFMIAAPSSGSGKTLITCGILQALVNRGHRIASFKCGPDYIDPMFHSKVIGTKSRNLDLFFTNAVRTQMLMADAAEDCDYSVIEGVMGYFDGLGLDRSNAGASDLAEKTDTPVFLIVPAKGVSYSIIPLIKGFLDFQKKKQIRGIILNRASAMVYPRMKEMIEEELKIPVVGYIPVLEDIHLESRHLGLVMPDEISELQKELQKLAKICEQTLDLDEMLHIAGSAPEFDDMDLAVERREIKKMISSVYPRKTEGLRIAYSSDAAFCFAYEDNLRLLRENGAELIPFSLLKDKKLPEHIDGLILLGGYPELYVKELSANFVMRKQILSAVKSGLPTIAECGGFLYLHRQIGDLKNQMYDLAGYFNATARYTGRLQRFGYITLTDGTFMGKKIGDIRAHEFHYYDSSDYGEEFLALKPTGNRSWQCVHGSETLYAGFPHLYFYSNPKTAGVFLSRCAQYHEEVFL